MKQIRFNIFPFEWRFIPKKDGIQGKYIQYRFLCFCITLIWNDGDK